MVTKEIKSIFDMDVDEFRIKIGDIKVDSEELRTLLRYIQQYHSLFCNIVDQLDSKEQDMINHGLRFTEFFQNKYIVLSELRQTQKFYYDILQKLNKKGVTKGYPEETVDRLRREVWEFYLDAKAKREALQAGVDKMKMESDF